jgi:Cof subfamily protein (haloacid dehalogenase superfamily)
MGVMQRRAVFLDVDGTLVDDWGHVPDSARASVRAARDRGHLVFLCTGRSLIGLWPEILDVGFDGLVAAAGGYVEHGGTVLAHHAVPTDQVRRVVAYFEARGVEYMLESNDGLFGSPGVRARLRQTILGAVTDEDILAELERGLMGFIDSIVVDRDPTTLHVNKVSFLHSEVTLEEIRAEFTDAFDVIPATVPLFGPNSGELSLRGVHKAAGMQVLIDHLGITREQTVAFGDGFNDLEMLQFAGVGIAMGQAPQAVKDVADQVTGRPDQDGIRTGFLRLGLI